LRRSRNRAGGSEAVLLQGLRWNLPSRHRKKRDAAALLTQEGRLLRIQSTPLPNFLSFPILYNDYLSPFHFAPCQFKSAEDDQRRRNLCPGCGHTLTRRPHDGSPGKRKFPKEDQRSSGHPERDRGERQEDRVSQISQLCSNGIECGIQCGCGARSPWCSTRGIDRREDASRVGRTELHQQSCRRATVEEFWKPPADR
jgi:hypothetical protein